MSDELPSAFPSLAAPVPSEEQTLEGPRYVDPVLLGEGGMGRVYAVRDRRLGRTVAMKVARDGRAEARLEREARVTAALDHPGIVTVLDTGRDEQGRAFYTMELVRGRTLSAVSRDPRDPRARLAALRLFHTACEAVAHAHDRGVVHCDLKPTNVMVGARDELLVVDWGLARFLDEPVRNEVVGTPGYWAPEQAAGAACDARTDVWGLGSILHELLHGGPPSVPLAPSEHTELDAILACCLAPDPDARFADAGALAEDVRAWLEGRLVGAHQYSPAALLRHALWPYRWGLAVILGLASIAVVGLVLTNRTVVRERDLAQRSNARATAAMEDARQHQVELLQVLARDALLEERSEDARALALEALDLSHDPVSRGILAALPPDPPRHLGTLPCDGWPSWDGAVLCPTEQGLRLVEADGTGWTRDDPGAREVVFSGHRIYLRPGRGLLVLDRATGETLEHRRAEPVPTVHRPARDVFLRTQRQRAWTEQRDVAVCEDSAVSAADAGPSGLYTVRRRPHIARSTTKSTISAKDVFSGLVSNAFNAARASSAFRRARAIVSSIAPVSRSNPIAVSRSPSC